MIKQQTIRIFISSTFKDMHSERDYLVKYVFPELRERCLKKGLHLIDVDLRWGVTEEEAEQGKALEICLDEIENCRPFFIGILGERYGWIPEQYNVPDHPKYDWLKKFEVGHSITALEIYQGVLNNPSIQTRAFFYFRNTDFIRKVPKEKQDEILPENPDAKKKLTKLKYAITQTLDKKNLACHLTKDYPCTFGGFRIDWPQVKADLGEKLSNTDKNAIELVAGKDNLVDPDEYSQLNQNQKSIINKYGILHLQNLEYFGKQVLNQIWDAIQTEFPDVEQAEDPLQDEIRYHDNFLYQRSRLFIGRQDVLGELNEYFIDSKQTQPLFIAGEAGTGKSALMAATAQAYKKNNPLAFTVCRFIGASPDSSDILKLLSSIIFELSAKYNLPTDKGRMDTLENLGNLFREMLYQINAKTSTLLIVLDAVNQLMPAFDPHYLTWLPMRLPSGIKILISTLHGTYLQTAQKYELPVLTISNMKQEDARQMVRAKLEEYRKKLTSKQLSGMLAKAEAGKPLFLAVACEELRIFPRFDQIENRIYSLPESIPQLFGQVLIRLEQDHDRVLVRDALCLIECSMHGLLEDELLELLKPANEERLPANTWARLFRHFEAYMSHAGDNRQGLINFFHGQFSEAVRLRYLQNPDSEIHYWKLLADYGLKKWKKETDIVGNTSLFAGIYLYKTTQSQGLTKLIQEVFTIDVKSDIHSQIVAELFDYVVKNMPYSEEFTLKQTLEGLLAEFPSASFAEFLLNKGEGYKDIGLSDWALFLFRLSIEVFKQLTANDPNLSYDFKKLSDSHAFAGMIYETNGMGEKALEHFGNSKLILQSLAEKELKNIEYVFELCNTNVMIGDIYTALGDGEKAIEYYLKDLEIRQDMVNKEPQRTDFRNGLAETYTRIGGLHETFGEGEKAMEFYLKDLEISQDLVNKEPQRTDFRNGLAGTYTRIGGLHESLGDGEKAMEYYLKDLEIAEDLVNKEPQRTDFRIGLAATYTRIGGLHETLGVGKKVMGYYLKALEITEDLVKKEPLRTDFKAGLAATYTQIGGLHESLGDGEKAMEYYLKDLEISQNLVNKEPQRTDFRNGLAGTYTRIGDLHESLGDGEKAMEFYLKDLEISLDLVNKEPQRTDFGYGLAATYTRIGGLHESMGDGEKAMEYYLKDLEIKEDLVNKEPQRTDFRNGLAVIYSRIGSLHESLGDGEKAMEYYLKDLEIKEDLVNKAPQRTDFRNGLAVIYSRIGSLHEILGDGEKAMGFYLKDLEISQDLVNKEPQRTDFRYGLAGTNTRIGGLHEILGDGEKAMEYYLKDLQIREDLVNKEPQRTDFRNGLALIYSRIGSLHEILGDGEKAMEFYLKNLQIREDLVNKEPQRTDFRNGLALIYSRIGSLHESLGDGDKALEYYLKDLEISQDLVNKEPQRTDFRNGLAVIYSRIGSLHESLGDGDKAMEFYLKDLEIAEDLVNKEPQRTDFRNGLAATYTRIGSLHESLGDGDKALEFYLKDLEIAEDLVNKEPQRTDFRNGLAATYTRIGNLYYTQDEYDNSIEYLSRALEIYLFLVKNFPQTPVHLEDLITISENISTVYTANDKIDKAIDCYRMVLNSLGKAAKYRYLFASAIATLQEKMADLYSEKHGNKMAIRYYFKAIDQLTDLIKHDVEIETNHHRHAKLLTKSAKEYHALKMPEEAIKLLNKAVKICDQLLAQHPGDAYVLSTLADSLNESGECHLKQNKNLKALAAFKRSLEIYELIFISAEDEIDVFLAELDLKSCYENLGYVYTALNKPRKAKIYSQKAEVFYESFLNSEEETNDDLFDWNENDTDFENLTEAIDDQDEA